MLNRIENIIELICANKRDTSLKSVILSRITEELKIVPNTLSRWRKNKTQPSITESAMMKRILNEYMPESTLDDIVVEEKAEADDKISKLFA